MSRLRERLWSLAPAPGTFAYKAACAAVVVATVAVAMVCAVLSW